jgi:exopolysaccharide biosynthesis polyprenyl glycosylphosphotransferase
MSFAPVSGLLCRLRRLLSRAENHAQILSARWALVLGVVAVDCLVVLDAFALAYHLRFDWQLAPSYAPPAPPEEYFKAMAVVAYFWLLLLKVHGLYDFSRSRSGIDTVYLVVRAVSFGTLIILSLTYFYREFSFSRLVCVYAWGIAIVLFALFRSTLGRMRAERHRRGLSRRRVLLIGARSLAAYLVEKMRSRPELGYDVVGALDDVRPVRSLSCPVLGGVGDLERVVTEQRVDRVFIAHPVLGHHQLLGVIRGCERCEVPLGMVPPTYDLLVNHRDFEEIDGVPLVRVNEEEPRWVYYALKRLFDVLGAAAALVLVAPLWLVIAFLIQREKKGPVLFRQPRVGKDGRVFTMLKFRTMVENAEALLGELVDVEKLREPVFKLDDDPRVTRLGRLLRKSSLDELPQLLNVLAGDMSLVGPRPEEEKMVRRYGVWEERRLKAKPGLTGLQQVECRGSVSLKERVRWDIVYLRKQSLLLDLWILLKTVVVVLSGRGAR